jgi:hypothetical protein
MTQVGIRKSVFTKHFQNSEFFIDANQKIYTYIAQQAAIQQIFKPPGHAQKAPTFYIF